MTRTVLITTLIPVLATWVASCGGGFRAGAAFAPGEARYFDDGVDMIRDPSLLGGQWAHDYRDGLDARVSLADLVALVDIVSLHTNRDIDGVEEKRIGVTVLNEIYGMAPTASLVLRSTPEAVGYQLIERYEAQLTGRFVAFVRFFYGGDGSLRHHFHLSPASPEVLKAVRARAAERIEKERAAQSG